MSVRAAGRASRRWTTQVVNIADPPVNSAAALVLLAKKYFPLDRSIYTEVRMTHLRRRWMKKQMKTLDAKGGLTCQICGKQGLQPHTKDKNNLATLDHIEELKHGGAWNDPTNFRVACYKCNTLRDNIQYPKKVIA